MGDPDRTPHVRIDAQGDIEFDDDDGRGATQADAPMPKHWKRPKNIVAAKSHFEHAGDCSEDERGHSQLTRGESDGAVDAPNDGCASVSRRRRSRSTDLTPRRAATVARGSYTPWWSRGLPAPYAQLRHLAIASSLQ